MISTNTDLITGYLRRLKRAVVEAIPYMDPIQFDGSHVFLGDCLSLVELNTDCFTISMDVFASGWGNFIQ